MSSRHVITDEIVAVQLKLSLGVKCLQGDAVKDLVDRVVGSDDANVLSNPWGEVQVLP